MFGYTFEFSKGVQRVQSAVDDWLSGAIPKNYLQNVFFSKFAKDCCFPGQTMYYLSISATYCILCPMLKIIIVTWFTVEEQLVFADKHNFLTELIRTYLWEHFPLDGHTGSKIEPQLIGIVHTNSS